MTDLSSEECLVCDRVGVDQFYRELRQMGFSRKQAVLTLKCLAQTYFVDHVFWAGRSRMVIKGGLAYLCGNLLRVPRITRLTVADTTGGEHHVEQTVHNGFSKLRDSREMMETILDVLGEDVPNYVRDYLQSHPKFDMNAFNAIMRWEEKKRT